MRPSPLLVHLGRRAAVRRSALVGLTATALLVSGLAVPPAAQAATFTVSGLVEDSAGQPVVGAFVEVRDTSSSTAEPVLGTTGEDGRYSLSVTDVPYGLVTARAPQSDRTLSSQQLGYSYEDTTASEPVVDFTLVKAAFYGQVTDPDGTPVQVEEFEVSSEDGSAFDVDVPVGPDGWYAVQATAPHTYLVTAGGTYDDLQHLHPARGTVEAATETGAVRLDLRLSAGNISGRVLTPDGDPVAGTDVYGSDPSGDAESADTTDETGYYTLDLPPGAVELEADAPFDSRLHDASRALTVPEAGVTDVDLVLRASNLLGTVTDSAGDPARFASVRLQDLTDPDASTRSFQAGIDGTFAVLATAGHTYRVFASPDPSQGGAPSYTASADVEVPAEGEATVAVQLRGEADLPYSLTRLSERPGEPPLAANERSEESAVAASGSVAVFTSYASNLHTTATESVNPHVYAKDLSTGAVELVDVNPAGAPGTRTGTSSGTCCSPSPGPSPTSSPSEPSRLSSMAFTPDVSDDGRFVVFASTADDLVGGDTNGQADVFVRDRQLDVTERVSLTAAGSQLASASQHPVISGDGRIVAFQTTASSSGADGSRPSVWVVDTTTGAVRVVPTSANGFNTSRPALDADGSTLAYLEADGEGSAVRVLELTGAAPDAVGTLAGRLSAGTFLSNEDGVRRLLSLSASGDRVAFADQRTRTATVLDVTALPSGGTAAVVPVTGTVDGFTLDVRGVALSPDGTLLALAAKRDADDVGQLYAQDLTRGVNELVTVGTAGSGITGSTDFYRGANLGGITADNRRIVLSVGVDGVISGDTNFHGDVFLARANTADAPPTFADGATLRATAVGSTVAELSWSAATDDLGVTGYRIEGRADGASTDTVLATFGPGVTSGAVSGLQPLTRYSVTVVATDAAEHVTAGPITSFTTTEPPAAGQALLSAEGRGDGVALAWEAKPGAGSYQVMRRGTGPAVAEVVATVDTTTYRDADVAAETGYRYQVRAVTDGTAADHTREVSVTTPALAVPAVTWTAPQLRAGTARLGSTFELTVTADPRRTVTAAVELTTVPLTPGADPAPAARTLALVEGPAGTYTADLSLSDGVASVRSAQVTVSDGAGHTAAAPALNLPLAVSGALITTIATPEGAIAPAKLSAYSPAQRFGTSTSAPAESTTSALVPASDYEVVAYDGSGRVLARRAGVVVQPGLTATVALDPAYPAALDLTVLADNPDRAGDPVAGANVTVTRAGSGTPLAGGVTAADGTLALRGDLLAGQDVVVRVELPRGLRNERVVTRPVTLERGGTALTVAAPALAPGTVRGTLRDEDGAPLSGLPVSVNQTVDGRQFLTDTATGSDGTFSLSALAGAGTVTAAVRTGSVTADVTVPAGGTVTQDLVYTPTRTYTIGLNVLTQVPGAGPRGPVTITGNFAELHRLRVATPNTALDAARITDRTVNVRGRAGERLTVCGRMVVDSQTLPERCVGSTLGTDLVVEAPDLLLSAPAVLQTTLQDASGADFRGNWTATAHVGDANSPAIATVGGEGSTLRMSVPDEGQYVLVVRSGELSGTTGGPVTAEDVALLAPVALQRTGAYSGNDSRVFSTSSQAVPGTTVPVRTRVRNDSTGVTSSTVVRLQVPLGTELPAGSVTKDGQPVATTADGGALLVDLGDVAPGAAHVLTYQLEVDEAFAAPQLVIGARVGYTDASGARSEALTPAALAAGSLTLTAPRDVTSRTVNVAGRAPAGAKVSVLAGVTTVGTALASPGGFWRATVGLPGLAPEQSYLLRAQATVGTATLTSGSEPVRYDSNAAQLTEVGISQVLDSKGYTFDPRKGLARFPFVFNPSRAIYIGATFDDPSKVANVIAHIGAETASAVRQSDGTFRATFPTSQGRGDIWVEYTPLPTPGDVNREVTEDEVRNSLPQGIADFTWDEDDPANGQPVADPDDPDIERSTVTFDLPGEGVPTTEEFTLEVERNAGPYQLTEADRERANATGLLIYDLKVEVGEDGLPRLSFRIPDRMLAPADETSGEGSGTMAVGAGGRTPGTSAWSAVGMPAVLRAAGLPLPRFPQQKLLSGLEVLDGPLQQEETSRILLEGTKSYLDTTVAPYQAATNSNYTDLAGLYPLLNGCNEEFAGPYKRRIEALLRLQIASDVMTVGLTVVGLITAPVGGLVISAVGGVVGLGLSYDFLQRFANLKLEMENLNCSERTGANGGYGPRGSGEGGGSAQGSPYWLHDPSGYLYEGVTSNRVEGVKASLMYSPAADGPWTLWDADFFGQVNPQVSNDQGRYGWDVPEGFYQVVYEKAGYETARSAVLEVLPPHFDVNIGMVALRGPALTSLTEVDADTLTITFDQWMDPATVTAESVRLSLGSTATTVVPVPVAPVTEDGRTLARAFTLELPAGQARGTVAEVTVATTAQNYSGRTADAAQTKRVTLAGAAAEPEPAPTTPAPAPTTPAPAPSATSPAPVETTAPAVPAPQDPAPTTPTTPAPPTPTPTSPTPTTPAPAADDPAYEAVAAKRVLDTREGIGAPPVARLGTVTVTLPQLPAGATAVLLNVTATGAERSGHVVAHRAGTSLPPTSNLNYAPGRTQANLVMVEVGADRKVALTAVNGRVHLVADLLGAFVAGDTRSRFAATAPTRAVDTRTGQGGSAGSRVGDVVLRLPSAVPADATSVLLNVTATAAGGTGHVTARPGGESGTATSSLNYTAGVTQANLVAVPIGRDRTVTLARAGAPAHLVVDVVGSWTGRSFTGAGTRLVDSRTGQGTAAGAKSGPVTVALPTAPSGASSVVLNLTVTAPSAAGYAVVHPAGSERPGTSNVNWRKGQTQANLVVVPVGPDGKVVVDVQSPGAAHVVVDLVGWQR